MVKGFPQADDIHQNKKFCVTGFWSSPKTPCHWILPNAISQPNWFMYNAF